MELWFRKEQFLRPVLAASFLLKRELDNSPFRIYSRVRIFIGALWGVPGIIKGSEALNIALHQVYMKTHFGKEMLRAVIEILLGVLLLVDAKEALKYHVFILGIELLMVGWRKHGKRYRAFMDKEVVRA